ncbi:MAG: Cof-type HAD-IIB family hydrolase [Candidatus Fimenecus sp.]
MKKRLAAVDIDGTLVTDTKELLPQTKADIQAFVKNGGVFVLATGRPTPGIRRYAEELDLASLGGYVISYNGARTFEANTNTLLFQKNIPTDCYSRIFDAADILHLPLTGYKNDIAVTEKANDRYFQMETTINRLEIQRVPDMRAEFTYQTPKFLITGEEKFLGDAEDKLRAMLSDLPLAVFRSEPFFLEITAQGCDKGAAVLELAAHLGLKPEETMACGDGFNDVTMLRAAGLGVAMENAQIPAKEAADYITDSNLENGVGKALRKFAI